jgi:hypothetical protein
MDVVIADLIRTDSMQCVSMTTLHATTIAIQDKA